MKKYECPKCKSFKTYKQKIRGNTRDIHCQDCGKYAAVPLDPECEIDVKISKSNKMGITLDELRKKHDVEYILSRVFEGLTDDLFYEKSDIIKMSGLRPGYPGLSTVLESENFKKYSGRAGGTSYYAKPELISKMKDEGILN